MYTIDFSQYITPAKEIDADRFNEMLEVLPPDNWQRMDGGEYFQMSELYAGNVTSYFVRHHDKYYEFRETTWMNPSQVLNKISGVYNGC